MESEFITIACVIGPQGRRGEVKATILTDFPERFAERTQLYALAADGIHRRPLHVEDHWPHKGMMVFKFAGIDSINDAETLGRCELQIPISQRVSLDPAAGAVFVSDLIGSTLSDRGRLVGVVEDVEFGAGEAPLLVVKGAQGEVLVPFAAAFIQSADLQHKKVDMQLPDGLLDVDAPLSSAERKLQQAASEAGQEPKE